MHDRSNGLGGGFAAYGIYPKRKDMYAFHMMFDNMQAKENTEEFFKNYFNVDKDEAIPTQRQNGVSNPPILWRYFLEVPENKLEFHFREGLCHKNGHEDTLRYRRSFCSIKR